jgi:uncharacterized surface protein with fasciclin (FAS1) repeats
LDQLLAISYSVLYINMHKFAAVAFALAAGAGNAVRKVQTSEAFNPAVGVHTSKQNSAAANSRNANVKMGDLLSTVKELQGPAMYWGSAGVLEGYEESDIKGYDNCGKFAAALESTGVAKELSGGEFTVFAPTDASIDFFVSKGGEVTADLIKYHVVKGKVPTTSLATADLTTLQGGKLAHKRFARKDFVNNAMVGVKSAGASRSQNFPSDVEADGGIVHTLNEVIKME